MQNLEQSFWPEQILQAIFTQKFQRDAFGQGLLEDNSRGI